jgi:hypothetical protein
MNRAEYEREVYDHERQRGEHAEPEWRPTEHLMTWTLRLMGPEGAVPEEMAGALSEAEENISDLLPEGYYVKIEEWDRA